VLLCESLSSNTTWNLCFGQFWSFEKTSSISENFKKTLILAKYFRGELPVAVRGGHLGVTVISYIVYQHPHCQVTQPLLVEQLRE
jgi:hypothetical protein